MLSGLKHKRGPIRRSWRWLLPSDATYRSVVIYLPPGRTGWYAAFERHDGEVDEPLAFSWVFRWNLVRAIARYLKR